MESMLAKSICLMLITTEYALAGTAPRESYRCGKDAKCDAERGFFCCGSCGNPFCCNDITLTLNSADCESTEDEKSIKPSAPMLGAILGGMAGSFCFAFLAQAIVRRMSARLRKWRRARAGNSEGSSAVPVPPFIISTDPARPPPVYEEAHLYRKLGEKANGDKQNYHWVADSAGVFSVLEVKVGTSTYTPDGSPPTYASVFPKASSEDKQPISTITTISETVGERAGEETQGPTTHGESVLNHTDTETPQTAPTRPKQGRRPFLHTIFAGPGCF